MIEAGLHQLPVQYESKEVGDYDDTVRKMSRAPLPHSLRRRNVFNYQTESNINHKIDQKLISYQHKSILASCGRCRMSLERIRAQLEKFGLASLMTK